MSRLSLLIAARSTCNSFDGARKKVSPGIIWPASVAIASLLRAVLLLRAARPKTPLRIACIAAFDTIHVLRKGEPLSALDARMLATWLDFGACANAAFDGKRFCRREYQATRRALDKNHRGPLVAEYSKRLAQLERSRPAPADSQSRFVEVGRYREAVVRLSLGTASTLAGIHRSLDDGIRATDGDADLNLLFKIVMLCQIIDDVLDYARDRAANLPSFLTACGSSSEAMEACRQEVRAYGAWGGPPRGDLLPFRIALFFASTSAKFALLASRFRYSSTRR